MTDAVRLGAPPPAARISVVVPVFNAMRFLPRTVPSLVAAVERHGVAELLFVDNDSTDESVEWLRRERKRVLSAPGATISRTRNLGARAGTGGLLAFVDADCLVPSDYLLNAESIMRDIRIDACGSRYRLPESPPPHWVERVWHDLHDVQNATAATYVPAGNFVVRRLAFEAVGGFREDLVTGEDADLGLRLNERGFVIQNSPAVWVTHLGNPRSVRSFYRKQRWHALGMFGTVRLGRVDRPVAMTALHLMILVASLALVIYRPGLALLALAAAWLVPVATVAFRMSHGGQVGTRAPAAVLLYQVYYLARIAAVLRIIWGRAGRRR